MTYFFLKIMPTFLIKFLLSVLKYLIYSKISIVFYILIVKCALKVTVSTDLPIHINLFQNGLINLEAKILSSIMHQKMESKAIIYRMDISLHKKGSTTKCGNYRTIFHLPHASKIMQHVIK